MDDAERADIQTFIDTVECLLMEGHNKLDELKTALAEQD